MKFLQDNNGTLGVFRNSAACCLLNVKNFKLVNNEEVGISVFRVGSFQDDNSSAFTKAGAAVTPMQNFGISMLKRYDISA